LYKKEKGLKCSNCGHVPILHTEISEGVLVKPSDNFYARSFIVSEEETDRDEDEDDDELLNAANHPPAGSNIDSQGTLRGRCKVGGCNCRRFSYVVAQGVKCSVCGHAPVRHEGDELEKDSPAVLFTSAQNKTSFSPLKGFSSISLSSDPITSSDLTIVDMEQDSLDSSPSVVEKKANKRLPTNVHTNNYEADSTKHASADSPSSHPHLTHTGILKKKKMQNSQSMVDNSMVPVYTQTESYQPSTTLPTYNQASLLSQFSGS